MAIITSKDLKKIEENYYWAGYKHWYPFPKELKEILLDIYGKESLPHNWTEQDIFEGSRKIIINFFTNNSI